VGLQPDFFAAFMGFIDLILHLLNFAAPAAFVALLMVLAVPFVMKKRSQVPVWWAQFAINFVVCLGALLIGLVVLGRDGKMLTYLALAVCCATSQWWMLRR
jgi:hypothetical protein